MNDLNSIVQKEMRKAVKAVLESKLSSDGDDEKRRQERLAKSVKERGIVADADKSAKPQDEAEKEEGAEEEEAKAEKEPREDRTGGKGTADSPKAKQPKTKTMKSPTIGSIVDKLNALRGGKSLKDPGVKESFAQYFEGLTTAEKQTLLAFLTGITQILVGIKDGADAMEPSDIGVQTKDAKKFKTPEKKEKPSSKTGTEDNPIIVGEHHQYDVIRALEAYRKASQ